MVSVTNSHVFVRVHLENMWCVKNIALKYRKLVHIRKSGVHRNGYWNCCDMYAFSPFSLLLYATSSWLPWSSVMWPRWRTCHVAFQRMPAKGPKHSGWILFPTRSSRCAGVVQPGLRCSRHGGPIVNTRQENQAPCSHIVCVTKVNNHSRWINCFMTCAKF